VRLIRSKGVGVFFVTQTPKDVPAEVLGQLGHRVQHALRAFTPDDQKALKATVKTFPHSAYDLEEVLTGLGIGEAVVTVLGERGVPTPVAVTRLRAPESRMGPVAEAALDRMVRSSPRYERYAQAVDRLSAYERLAERPAAAEGPQEVRAATGAPRADAEQGHEERGHEERGHEERGHEERGHEERGHEERGHEERGPAGRKAKAEEEGPSMIEQVAGSGVFKSLARSVGTHIGREITRSLFGTARRGRR
jgi:hypothetical protein